MMTMVTMKMMITCLRFIQHKESSKIGCVRSYYYHRKASPHLKEIMMVIIMVLSMGKGMNVVIMKISMPTIVPMIMRMIVQIMPRNIGMCNVEYCQHMGMSIEKYAQDYENEHDD